ncbi:hypothetical protein [Streptomyces klenkii]
MGHPHGRLHVHALLLSFSLNSLLFPLFPLFPLSPLSLLSPLSPPLSA